MEEYYNVKWYGYTSTFSSYLREIFNEEKYCDATIICQGKHYMVHRLVLSLGSNYFDDILKMVPDTQPVILIDDIDSLYLQKILIFMYSGKVFIDKTKLPQFLKVAKLLQVKGLCNVSDGHSLMEQEESTLNCSRSIAVNDCDFPGFNSMLEKRPQNILTKIFLDGTKERTMQIMSNKENCHHSNCYKGSQTIQICRNKSSNVMKLKEQNWSKLRYWKIIKNPFVRLHRLNPMLVKCAENGLQIDSNCDSKILKEINYAGAKIVYDNSNDARCESTNDQQAFQNMEKDVSQSYFIVPRTNMRDIKGSSLRELKQCNYCTFQTKSLSSIRKHFKNHQLAAMKTFDKVPILGTKEIRGFKCNTCSFRTSSKLILQVHKHSVHLSGERVFRCKICPYESYLLSEMRKHKILHKKQKVFKCMMCSFTASSEERVLQHKSIHMKSTSSYNSHLVLSKPSPFTFDQFYLHTPSTLSEISNHEIFHDAGMEVKQANPSSTYMSAWNLYCNKESESVASTNDDTIFKCKYCPYTSTSKSAVTGHEVFHDGDEPFKCSFCSYKSGIKAMVTCHEMTHKYYKPTLMI